MVGSWGLQIPCQKQTCFRNLGFPTRIHQTTRHRDSGLHWVFRCEEHQCRVRDNANVSVRDCFLNLCHDATWVGLVVVDSTDDLVAVCSTCSVNDTDRSVETLRRLGKLRTCLTGQRRDQGDFNWSASSSSASSGR